MNPSLTLVSYNEHHRNLLLNFVEKGECCSVFAIAENLGYITKDERHEILYSSTTIKQFVECRIMMAMIILMDNGEEF